MTRTPGGTAYDVYGSIDSPAMVLIHGLGLTRDSTWSQMIPELARQFRLITYDLSGHGESAVTGEPASLTILSEQLCELLDHLRIKRAVLVGFSLGGMINRRFAMDNPGRTTALIILNSPHERSPEQQKLVEERAADTSTGGPGATLDVTLERWFTPQFRSDRPDMVDRVRQTVLANDATNYAAHRLVLARGVIELIRPDPPLSEPTLVMSCERDTGSTPAMSQGIAAEITGAQTVILPNLQHLGLIERPDLFQRAITEFLRIATPEETVK